MKKYRETAEELEERLKELGFETTCKVITNAVQLITPANPFRITLRINISTEGYMEFDSDDIFIAGKRFYFDSYTVDALMEEVIKELKRRVEETLEDKLWYSPELETADDLKVTLLSLGFKKWDEDDEVIVLMFPFNFLWVRVSVYIYSDNGVSVCDDKNLSNKIFNLNEEPVSMVLDEVKKIILKHIDERGEEI